MTNWSDWMCEDELKEFNPAKGARLKYRETEYDDGKECYCITEHVFNEFMPSDPNQIITEDGSVLSLWADKYDVCIAVEILDKELPKKFPAVIDNVTVKGVMNYQCSVMSLTNNGTWVGVDDTTGDVIMGVTPDKIVNFD